MLPITLKTKQNYELIRLGSRYDGGYLVFKNSILESEFLLSGVYFMILNLKMIILI